MFGNRSARIKGITDYGELGAQSTSQYTLVGAALMGQTTPAVLQ